MPAGSDFKADLEARFKLVGRDAVDTASWLRSAEISAAELADLGLLEEGDVREFAKGLSKTGAAKLVMAWRTCGAGLPAGGGVRVGNPGGFIPHSVPISKSVHSSTPTPQFPPPSAAVAAVVSSHAVAKGTRSHRPRSSGL